MAEAHPKTGKDHQGHPNGQDHQVNFGDISVIAAEENYHIRVILEALNIAKLSRDGNLILNENFERDGRRVNRSDGVRLSPLWQPIIAKM